MRILDDVQDGERKRLILTGALITVLTAGAAAAGAALVPALAKPLPTPSSSTVASTEPPVPVSSPSASPSAAPSASPTPIGPVRPADQFANWANPLVNKVGIPKIALEAYGYAEYVIVQRKPTCKLQWTSLAALAKVHTDHGRSGDADLDTLGRAVPLLIGPALKGSDTDAGILDNDKVLDHAVGPFQFPPVVWRAYGLDADGDQLADPHDIDDAALTAANLLCAPGKDLSVVANWKAAIAAFPGIGNRIDKVYEAAQSYGVKSKG